MADKLKRLRALPSAFQAPDKVKWRTIPTANGTEKKRTGSRLFSI
uniref:Conjugal transfer protein n=1 Tax=Steinernema glaseri TaxID=37863 RepID=A0A1I7ZMV6_9BILA